MRRNTFALFVTVVALAVGGAACGSSGGSSSSSKSAQDAVCSDATALKTSVDKLVSDVKSGNFGNAKDELSKVESNLKALGTSAKKLASSKKTSVQADLDKVKDTLGGLTKSSSGSDIQKTLKDAQTQLQDTADSITNTLSC